MDITDQKEISIIDVFRFLFEQRRKLALIVFVFMSMGLFVSLDAEVLYTSYSKVIIKGEDIPGPSSALLSKLSGFGIDLGSSTSSGNYISPMVYGDIIRSNQFIWGLGEKTFLIGGEHQAYKSYLDNEVRKPLMITVLNFLKSFPSRVYKLIKSTETTVQENDDPMIQVYGLEGEKFIENLRDKISLTIEENGTIIIGITSPNPRLAAEINKECLLYLETFIYDVRVQDLKSKLNYLETELARMKKQLEASQLKYTKIKDRHIDVSSTFIQTEIDRVKKEYDLNFQIYSSFLQQFEETKIEMSANTAVFKILEPAKIPAEKSEPGRTLIVLAFTMVGFVLAIVYTYLEKFIKEIWVTIKNNEI